jgi:hypothetical protein
MMIPGVHALVLAAATAALPFTPPAGWAQLPQSAVSVRASTWTGPKTAHATPANFSVVVFPFPGTLDLLVSKPPADVTGSGLLKQVSSVPVKLCGVPGRIVTTRTTANGASSLVQREVTVKGGYAYMLAYTRSSNTAADPRIPAVMRAFCPSGTAQLPQPAMPAGWAKSGSDLQMTGMWMGTRPGEVMMLMRGTQAPSLDQLFTNAKEQSVKAPSGKNVVTINPSKSVTMCGYPGMLVDMNVNIQPMPMAIHMALTQGNGLSYVLMYTQMGGNAPDPAAVAALQTLCVNGASTAPSASPSASASPSPTPSPSSTP